MAAAARRPAPIYMFNCYADMSQLTGEPAGEGWAKMACDSKKAYGYGENIQEAVKGLSLYVRLGADPLITSSLAIRMTDDALRRFNEQQPEVDVFPPWLPEWFRIGIRPRRPEVWAQILMHAEDLTIIKLCFDRPSSDMLVYNLVYDHKRASLSIVSIIKPDPGLVFKPVLMRTCNGDYELFCMGFDRADGFPFAAPDINPAPFLCVFSPVAAAAAATAWKMRRNVVWSVPVSVHTRFRVDLSFSFQGKGFWVDLSQGLIYCDLEGSAAGDSVVVDFCPLPHKCVLDWEKVLDRDAEPMEVTRTMGCDRDSIWFVEVDCADNNSVSMWSLKLQGGTKPGQWKNEAKFSLKDLRRFDGFKELGLPKQRVRHPLLNAADGVLVLYLAMCGEVLGTEDAGICWEDHMCSFDVRNKKLLWHGTVHNLPTTQPIPSCLLPSLLQPVARSTLLN